MSILLNERANASPSSHPDFPKDDQGQGDCIRAVFVDDDDDYREAATAEFEHFGFEVIPFPSGEAMLEHFERDRNADVIVLDWKLQSCLGIDFLPKLHDCGVNLPVVFLTGMPTTAYEYAALDRGAVDFVDKARGIAVQPGNPAMRQAGAAAGQQPRDLGRAGRRPDGDGVQDHLSPRLAGRRIRHL